MTKAIEYFTVFGGVDIKIDTNENLDTLIEKHILKNYSKLKSEIGYLTGGYSIDHAILTGIALGDRKTTNAFKRSHVSFEEGMKSIDALYDKEIIEIDSSANYLLNKRGDSKTSKKLFFANPFLRFWFGFVSPIYKGIRDGDFKEFNEKFSNRKHNFSDFIFEELCIAYTKAFFKEDPIKDVGQYWNETSHIPVIAKTQAGKTIVGTCKYTNSKIKKTELTTLLQTCKENDIKADIVLLFSKNGFTNELKSLKSDTLKLFTAKSLKLLTK